MGSRRARCSTAIATAPNRWKTVGSASIMHRWPLDRDANEPHAVYGQKEVGDHYSPTMLGHQPEIHQILMINE
eukprot:6311679-Pyramimonas_sp.AAC.1